jgi:hypothetical protein
MITVVQKAHELAERFINASPKNPCPVCGAKKWCGFNGSIAFCMYESAGAIAEVPYRDGSGRIGYIHSLEGAVDCRPAVLPDIPVVTETAPVDGRDRVYRDFLAGLRLEPLHRKDLHRRGLSDERIAERGYRSVPGMETSWAAIQRLLDLGHRLDGIPGFYLAQGRRRNYWTYLRPTGYFIPVHDAQGRIQAMQIRRDDASDGGGKYFMFSSGSRGGANAHTPAHVARPAVLNDRRIWITEGALKADIASDRLSAFVVGAIGVDSWPQIIPVLQELGARSVVLAFDADEAGRKVNWKAKITLESQGYAVAEASWEGAKGIDDALVSSKLISVDI